VVVEAITFLNERSPTAAANLDGNLNGRGDPQRRLDDHDSRRAISGEHRAAQQSVKGAIINA
jgi:hypothetical protein